MTQTAIVFGVGAHQGIGAAIGRRFAEGGLHVILAGRNEERLRERQADIEIAGGSADIHPVDVRKEDAVAALFDSIDSSISAVVFNPGANVKHPLVETEAWLFEHLWRVACFGGFLVAREATKRMAESGGGSLLYTGATGSLRGAAGHSAFAAAKAGLRMVAESAAREYGPRGVHVAHVIVDGVVNGDKVRAVFPDLVARRGDEGLLNPDSIAEAFWQLHVQPRNAWTFELDLRPYSETF